MAIIATVLIVVLGKDDKKEASGGGGNGGGDNAGSSATCEDGEYGLKVDPQTGETIECTGGNDADPETDAAVTTFGGTWTVTSTITYISGDLTDGYSGAPLVEGDSSWSDGPHDWNVITPYCTGGSECSTTVTDMNYLTTFTLDVSGNSWVGETTIDITCEDSTTDPIDVTIEIELKDSEVLTGTMSTSGSGPCGGSPVSIEEDLILEKQ
ncbi:hypothetical protein EK0264_11835 [Epidermidibacterium keratini]|uniref:Uncharacterized protein n=1 Tax=Epidermidibacterium keratini TaxID=1891644 RepID=A0A7L4YP32_9ACTN|nr:hypothetical protein EK0264_11835 [Epidermidibacterium keratini]